MEAPVNKVRSAYCLLANGSSPIKFLNGYHGGQVMQSVCEQFGLCHSCKDCGTAH